MARLPLPGGDDGNWGEVLNTFLKTAHNTDGTLKGGSVVAGMLGSSAVSTAHLQNGSVTAVKLSAPSPSDGQVLGYTGGALAWTTPSAGGSSTPVATTTATGTITLAGDLGGTAAAPTVPGLAGKANTSDLAAKADVSALAAKADVSALTAKADKMAVVDLTTSQSIAGNKSFTGTVQVGGQAVVVANDARLTDQRTPSNTSVTMAKLSAGTGTDGQVLSVSGGVLAWTTGTGSGSVADATTGAKGIVQLAGDLGGNAAAPTVPGLALKADASALAAKADTAAVVQLANNQTITGVKTFSASPVVPDPTTGGQAANKTYVDSKVVGSALATTTTTGTITLAGDFGGTAAAPVIAAGVVTEAKLATAVQTKLNAVGGAVSSVAGKTGAVTLAKADVGLANVDNTTDANKPVSAATLTALNTKAATSHTHDATDITAGRVAPARLGSGTANTTTYLRGDGQWATPAGGGGGGYSYVIRHVTADVQAAANDMIFVDSLPAMVTVTLPAPTVNAVVRVKRMAPSGNGLQVQVLNSATTYIDATTVGSHVIPGLYESQDFWSDGTNWFRV